MSAAAGAAAAARRREELRLEEEQETAPMAADDGYEYKIIRSAWASFRSPSRLQSALETEARAGWDLYEKLDNSRVRLRRPVTCRQHDAELNQDPYRIWIGPTENMIGIVVVLVIFMVVFTVIALVNLLH